MTEFSDPFNKEGGGGSNYASHVKSYVCEGDSNQVATKVVTLLLSGWWRFKILFQIGPNIASVVEMLSALAMFLSTLFYSEIADTQKKMFLK